MLDRREAWLAATVAGGLHTVVAAVAVLRSIEGSSEWYDQRDYHLPVIERFAAELPAPVLSDYQSATTPLYHLFMAMLVRLGLDGMALHAVNLAFGVALVAVFAAFIARKAGLFAGAAAGAALGMSPYLLSSSVWLTTDNAATLMLVLAFVASAGIACGCVRMPVRSGVLAAGWALLAAAVRQIMLYTAAFPAAAVVARACAERRRPAWRELLVASLALLPAAVLVGSFVALWGGLVPPSFRAYHGGGANAATPVYVLALVGVWGGLACASIPGFFARFWTARTWLAGALALAAALLVPSNYVVHVRFGGVLWTLASRLPAPFERSVVLVPLAAVGAMVLVAYLRLWTESRDRAARGVGAFALLALLGMTLAQTANQQCFERYMQPLVVVFCTVAAAALAGRSMRAWPLALAACAAFGLSLFNVFRAGG
jgi:hypothetical protein